MTTYEALLRGVLDAPDDDAPRLVLADWHEERGEAARAEFIRVQCELAKAAPCAAECRNRIDYECPGCALRRRERELMGPGKPRWWSDYGPGDKVAVMEWRRGFAEVVAVKKRDWFAGGVGPRVVRLQPVRFVRLFPLPDTDAARMAAEVLSEDAIRWALTPEAQALAPLMAP